MNPSSLLKEFLLDNENTMTLDLIARTLNQVFDKAEIKILIERLQATPNTVPDEPLPF